MAGGGGGACGLLAFERPAGGSLADGLVPDRASMSLVCRVRLLGPLSVRRWEGDGSDGDAEG